jgi:membrane-associated phospholipid phosphatase
VRLWLIAGVLLVIGAKAAALAAVGYHYLTDGLGGAGLAISVVLAVALILDAGQKLVSQLSPGEIVDLRGER